MQDKSCFLPRDGRFSVKTEQFSTWENRNQGREKTKCVLKEVVPELDFFLSYFLFISSYYLVIFLNIFTEISFSTYPLNLSIWVLPALFVTLFQRFEVTQRTSMME